MTADELDKGINEIKKKGLNKIVELEKIRKLREGYYTEKNDKSMQIIAERFYRNIMFLSNKFKSFPSSSKIKEFMGIDVSNTYDNFVKNNSTFFTLKDAVIVSGYYGVPVNLLLFDDLEIYGEQIWKEYHTLFKQG